MISVTLIVKDGARRLHEVLEALRPFPEVLLLDTGSTDATLEIAATFPNVRITHAPFTGFGQLRNLAADRASHPWILAIDADEVVSPALCQEILSLNLKEELLYALPFHNFFNGKRITGCGWGGRTHIRLYNRTQTRFSEAAVHEGVEARGLQILTLTHPVLHTPYESLSDFLIKMERYSTLFAKQYCGRKTSSPLHALAHGLWAGFKSFFVKKGCLLGYEGFVISVYNGHTAFYKYLKLYESNTHRAHVPPDREREACERPEAF